MALTSPDDAKKWEAFGTCKTVREWSLDPRCVHGDLDLIHGRLRHGMGIERALTQPKLPYRGARKGPLAGVNVQTNLVLQTLTAFRETKTVAEWLADPRCQLKNCRALLRRIEIGMTVEQAFTKLTRGKQYVAFGESKSLLEWTRDPRCVPRRAALLDRLAMGIPFVDALTKEKIDTGRKHNDLACEITAFGQTKTLREWSLDPRCEVGPSQFLKKFRRGIAIDQAFKSKYGGKPDGVIIAAFGESKNIIQWSQDPRCRVSQEGLRRRLQAGEVPELAITRARALPASPVAEERSSAGRVQYRSEHLPYLGFEIVAFGETRTAEQWSEDPRCIIGAPQILERIRNGMSAEDAITAISSYDTYEAWGERKTVHQWGHDPRSAVTDTGLRMRLQSGVPFEIALTTPAWIPLDDPIYFETYEAFGERKPLLDWLADDRCLAPRANVVRRLKSGRDLEHALLPLAPNRTPPLTAFGETKTYQEWERDPRCEVTVDLLHKRINRGIEPEDAMRRDARVKPLVLWEAFGERKISKEWAEDARCVVSYAELLRRLRRGMAVEEAVTTRQAPDLIEAFGEQKTLADWARDPRAAVCDIAIRQRLRKGYPPEMAITDPPIGRKNRAFWDLERRGIDESSMPAIDAASKAADGRTPKGQPARHIDMDRLEEAFRRSLGGDSSTSSGDDVSI